MNSLFLHIYYFWVPKESNNEQEMEEEEKATYNKKCFCNDQLSLILQYDMHDHKNDLMVVKSLACIINDVVIFTY